MCAYGQCGVCVRMSSVGCVRMSSVGCVCIWAVWGVCAYGQCGVCVHMSSVECVCGMCVSDACAVCTMYVTCVVHDTSTYEEVRFQVGNKSLYTDTCRSL